MGLFDFFKRKNESVMPEPGTPEFDAAVAGSALPDSTGTLGVEPDQWQQVTVHPSETVDLRGTGAREEMLEALKRHGIDAQHEGGEGQQIDASANAALQKELLEILEKRGVDPDGPGN